MNITQSVGDTTHIDLAPGSGSGFPVVVPRKYSLDPVNVPGLTIEHPASASTALFILDNAKALATDAGDAQAVALISAQYPAQS